MKYVLVSLASLILVFGKEDSSSDESNEPIDRLKKAPWQAGVIILASILHSKDNKNKTEYRHISCSASIIGNKHLLTAASCWHRYELLTNNSYKIVTGQTLTVQLPDANSMLSNDSIVRHADKVVMHPKYDIYDPTHRNDIAIILLREPVPFSENIAQIKLLSLKELAGDWTYAYGYEDLFLPSTAASDPIEEEEAGEERFELQSEIVKIIPNELCSISAEDQICTIAPIDYDNKEASPFAGEPGGSLVIYYQIFPDRDVPYVPKPTLVGVMSHYRSPHSAVYISVSSHADFIIKHTKFIKIHIKKAHRKANSTQAKDPKLGEEEEFLWYMFNMIVKSITFS